MMGKLVNINSKIHIVEKVMYELYELYVVVVMSCKKSPKGS